MYRPGQPGPARQTARGCRRARRQNVPTCAPSERTIRAGNRCVQRPCLCRGQRSSRWGRHQVPGIAAHLTQKAVRRGLCGRGPPPAWLPLGEYEGHNGPRGPKGGFPRVVCRFVYQRLLLQDAIESAGRRNARIGGRAAEAISQFGAAIARDEQEIGFQFRNVRPWIGLRQLGIGTIGLMERNTV